MSTLPELAAKLQGSDINSPEISLNHDPLLFNESGLWRRIGFQSDRTIRGARLDILPGSLVITGTASLLGMDQLPVIITLTRPGDRIILQITLASPLPEPFRLADSFPAAGGIFEELTLNRMNLAIRQEEGASGYELRLTGDIPAYGLNGAEVITGKNHEEFRLIWNSAGQNDFPNLAGITVSRVGLEMIRPHDVPRVFGKYFITIMLGSTEIPLEFDLPAPEAECVLRLEKDKKIPLPGLSEIGSFLGLPNLNGILPEQLMALSKGYAVNDFQIALNMKSFLVRRMSLGLESANVWPIFNQLAVAGLRFFFEIVNHGEKEPKLAIGLKLAGDILIGKSNPVSLPVSIEKIPDTPEWILEIASETPVSIPSIPDLLDLIGATNPFHDLPNRFDPTEGISLVDLELRVNPSLTGFSIAEFSGLIMVNHHWDWLPGWFSTESAYIRLQVLEPLHNLQVSGIIGCQITVCQVPFEMTAVIPDFELRGRLAPDAILNVTAIFRHLLEGHLQIPENFPEIAFQQAYAMINVKKGSLALQAQSYGEWKIVPGWISVRDVNVDLAVQSLNDEQNRNISGCIAGKITLFDQMDIDLKADCHEKLLFHAEIPEISSTNLLEKLLPGSGVSLPGFTLANLLLEAVPGDYVKIRGELQNPAASLSFQYSVEPGQPETKSQRKTKINGELTFQGIIFELQVESSDTTALKAVTKNLNLSHGVEKLLGTGLPPELPELTVAELTLELDTQQNIHINGNVTLSGTGAEKLTIGALALPLASLSFDFKHIRKADSHDYTTSANFKVNVAQELEIIDGFRFHHFEFTLAYSSQSNTYAWELSGNTRLNMGEEQLEFGAAYISKNSSQFFSIYLLNSKPLIKIPGIAVLSCKTLELSLQTGSVDTAWGLSAQGDMVLYDITKPANEILSLKDLELSLAHGGGKKGGYTKLEFAAPETGIALPEPLDRIFPAINTGLGGTIEFIKDAQGKYQTLITLTGNGHPFIKIPIPDLFKAVNDSAGDQKFLPELGEGYLTLQELKLDLGKNIALDFTAGLGLPAKLNELFGLKPHQILKTNSPVRVQLSIGTKGFSGQVLDSPFQKIDGIRDITIHDQPGLEIDLDRIFGETGLGLFRIQKPELSFNLESGSFKASGGYEIDPDRGLKLPLFPLKKALELVGLQSVAGMMPPGLPVRSVSLVEKTIDPKTGQEKYCLISHEITKLFTAMGLELPEALGQIIDQVNQSGGEIAGRLPSRFVDYLSIKVPQAFNFSLEVTGDGGVSFALEIDRHGDPLQLLIPNINPPQFLGLRIYKLAFGTAFGGSLLKAEIDAEFDNFDLVTLAGALVLPRSNFLPDRKQLQQTVIIRDLITLIVYESGIPIPIPLFYEELSLTRLGIDGLEIKANIALPKPAFNAKELLQRFNELKNFFNTPYSKDGQGTVKGLLPVKSDQKLAPVPLKEESGASSMDLRFSAGPLYIRLPKYLGIRYYYAAEQTHYSSRKELARRLEQLGLGETEIERIVDSSALNSGQLIGIEKPYTVSAWDLAYIAMNSIKLAVYGEPFINYFIQRIPLDDRLGNFSLSIFEIFELSVVWALTTPYEFANEAYSKLKNKYNLLAAQDSQYAIIPKESTADELLELLNQNDTGRSVTVQDDGLALFLRGGLKITDGFILETALGLVAGGPDGFRTGVSFYGFLADIIEARLLGFIKISPRSKTETFKLLGQSSLSILNRQVLQGLFELTNERMLISGVLDAFPADWPLALKGYINGYISPGQFYLDSGANFEIGALKALAHILIQAREGLNLFKLDLVFLNSELHINFRQVSRETGGAMDLDVHLKAFLLLEFSSQLKLAYGIQTGIALAGHSRFTIGYNGWLITRIESYLNGIFDPKAGFLGIRSELGPGSYLFGPDCRISGGFAFYNWFSNGDFVLTIGGYHPEFQPPSHYPAVPRVGINWQIDNNTSIKGNAYFALTPSCIMAGGNLSLNYQNGNLRAWFSAEANLLAQWQPLYYSAQVRLNVGVSYRLDLLFASTTIAASLDTELELWGPPTGGTIRVDWTVISFTIGFGAPKNAKPNPLSWAEFRATFPQDKPLNRITMDNGIIRQTEDGLWLIDAHEFQFSTESVIPVNRLVLRSDQETDYVNRTDVYQVDIRPMAKKGLNASQVLTIEKEGAGPVNLQSAEMPWILETYEQNLPEALWGEPVPPGETPQPTARLLPNRMVGFNVTAPRPNLGTIQEVIDVPKNMAYTPVEPGGWLPLPATMSADDLPLPREEQASITKISQTLTARQPVRDGIYGVLQKMGTAPSANGTPDQLGSNAAGIFREPTLLA